jgi:hypothetical protein
MINKVKLFLMFAVLMSIFIYSISDAQFIWEGDYTIDNATDIANLSGYTKVTGTLIIGENYNFENLAGLENLTSVGRDLSINNNDALTSLSALDNLTSVGGDLNIGYNDALTSLSGLNNLTSVDGDLNIGYNNALISLSAPSNLTSVSGVRIESNEALTSLSGLESLTSVGGDLMIFYNTALTNLKGLDNLTSVGGVLGINSNDALTNLCSLYKVYLYGNSLFIHTNTKLSMETAYALETQLRNNGFTGTATIHDNNGTGLVICKTVPCFAQTVLGEGNPKLDTMRRFRDEVLSTTPVGRKIIQLYYQLDENMVDVLEDNPKAREFLKPMINSLIPAIELFLD